MNADHDFKKSVLIAMVLVFAIAGSVALVVQGCKVFFPNGNVLSAARARLAIYQKAMHPGDSPVDIAMERDIHENYGIKRIAIISVKYHQTKYGNRATVLAQVSQRRKINHKTGMSTATYLVTAHLIHTAVGWRVDKRVS
jgi:hypothetical protein